jgi:hypothetical protein
MSVLKIRHSLQILSHIFIKLQHIVNYLMYPNITFVTQIVSDTL